jgi:hypothetical protein
VNSLVFVTVANGDNFVVLAAGELPAQTTSATGAVTTLGTVTALHGGTFATTHSLLEVAGTDAISPLNLMIIVDGATRDPILSAGGQVYGLLHGESGLTDGVTITDATTTRVQISFVRVVAAGNDLEAVPIADIEDKVINYCTRERVRLEDLNEADFLSGAIVDVPSGSTVTRQIGYTNQGATVVTTVASHTLDVGAGLTWEIGDLASAPLFQIIEGSGGGTSQVNINSDVDEFDVDAAVNNFLQGMTIDSGATRVFQIGVNEGLIETTSGDMEVKAAAELILNDTNMVTEGTWTGPGVKVSETTAEVAAWETAFGGEVSIMNAVVQAYNAAAGGGRLSRVYSEVTASVAANVDLVEPTNLDTALGDLSLGTFITDYDIFFNGRLQETGVDLNADNDVYPGTTPASGMLKAEFKVKIGDKFTVIRYG